MKIPGFHALEFPGAICHNEPGAHFSFMTDPVDKEAKLRDLTAKVVEIPPLPSFIGKILQVAENPISSAEDLNEIISRDPALTAQILKAANSAFYGFPNKIGTVSLAIIILGFNMVRTIALSSSVIKLFKSSSKKSGHLDPVRFWDHSLKCGVACRMLASNYKYFVAGEAFTAGILHDIGRIALAHYFSESYDRVLERVHTKGGSFLEAEIEILGFTHAEFGGFLLKKWNLPPFITDAVMFHHEPTQAANARELAALTHFADYLCHRNAVEKGEERDLAPLDHGIWDVLERSEDEEKTIIALLTALNSDLEKSDHFFRILHGEDENPPPTHAPSTPN